MPYETSIRAINLKLLEIKLTSRGTKYKVYNLHNDTTRTFTSIERMINYHSPNTHFINIKTSKPIDKIQSLQTGTIVYHNVIITVKGTYQQNRATQYFALNNVDTPLTNVMELIEAGTQVQYFPFSLRYRIFDILNSLNIARLDTQINVVDVRANVAGQQQPTERIDYNLIHGYHSGPSNINFLKTQHDDANYKRYFGIELEIDGSRDRDTSHEKRHRLATRLNKLFNGDNYNSLVKFENDSSLGANGIEIITQPMSMKYIMENVNKFAEGMRMIEELDYVSHDSGKCGMHIHVSKEALNDNIIDNLYLLFENFRNELVAFSRRTQDGMRWCRFMTDISYHPDQMDEDYIKRNKPQGNDHGSCINSGQRNTVEFRLFRGTTKMKTFIANIQLIDNIVDIASKDNIEEITWDDIINLKPEYTELIAYNEKRAIISKHKLSKTINKMEITARPVILVRPFQLSLAGDN